MSVPIFSLRLGSLRNGHRPAAFHGGTGLSTLSAILRKEPKPPCDIVPAVPVELEKIIARCLRKDPERRAQRIDDIKWRWRAQGRVRIGELSPASQARGEALRHRKDGPP